MSIIRTVKNTNYTILSNVAANDTRLSLKSLGLFYFLMAKPNNWKITERGLFAQRPEGRTALSSALGELEEAGYLERQVARGEDGKFMSGDVVLHEEPWLDNPTTDNPSAENRPQVITNIVNNNKDLLLTEEGAKPDRVDKRDPEVTQVVEKFEAAMELRLPRLPYQRRAAKTLIDRHGLENTLRVIDAVVASRGREWSPQILSLEQLRDKWENLADYYKRLKKEKENKVRRIV